MKDDIRKKFNYSIEDNIKYYRVHLETDPERLEELEMNIYKFIAALQEGLKTSNKNYRIISKNLIKIDK